MVGRTRLEHQKSFDLHLLRFAFQIRNQQEIFPKWCFFYIVEKYKTPAHPGIGSVVKRCWNLFLNSATQKKIIRVIAPTPRPADRVPFFGWAYSDISHYKPASMSQTFQNKKRNGLLQLLICLKQLAKTNYRVPKNNKSPHSNLVLTDTYNDTSLLRVQVTTHTFIGNTWSYYHVSRY